MVHPGFERHHRPRSEWVWHCCKKRSKMYSQWAWEAKEAGLPVRKQM
jgi:hypothetical protein